MKLVRFNDWSTGVLGRGDEVVDISDLAGREWTAMIGAWDQVRDEVAARAAAGPAVPLSDVVLQPPLVSPHARIFALGSNFADHAAAAKSMILKREVTEAEVLAEHEAGLPPWGFVVVPETIIGDGGTVVAPRGATMLDYEVEVCAVLGAGGRDVTVEDVRIWGYTAWNDLGIRDHYFGRGEPIDRGILSWNLQKNFMGANACGPWVCVDEPYDVGNLAIGTRVNGEVRQQSSTKNMIWSFAETAAHLSGYIELLPGDGFVSGTPAGTAIESGPDGPFLRPGDRVEIEVEGVGVLTTLVGGDS
ncbi:fumarylacetoacetate hydrolase family protein [Sporichthya sp.]|uniref:fumarylacetoacetate hydrolase family protein n=1 Tax=Sporichthya sp. TaxID=65475 RepID=UPI001849206C|nr:fumarylacetoacetate hydrolase family protein [Sporichthya sp.]MBA3741964.1 fumarylacetoacetate hydrolase family protein [Sporichthya sp.]